MIAMVGICAMTLVILIIFVVQSRPQKRQQQEFAETKEMPTRSILLPFMVLGLLGALNGVEGWTTGDVIPLTASIRVNGSLASHATPFEVPLDFSPRFGVDKVSLLPSADYSSHETDVLIKFELGRGINRGTKWLTLKKIGEGEGAKESHMTSVVFKFGYQAGAVGHLTSFKAFATFSERPHETIMLKYEWDEHRAYNPHTALTVVSVLSILSLIVVAHRMVGDSFVFAKKMKHLVVVRERSD